MSPALQSLLTLLGLIFGSATTVVIVIGIMIAIDLVWLED